METVHLKFLLIYIYVMVLIVEVYIAPLLNDYV